MSGSRRRSALTGSALSSALARWTSPQCVKSVQRGTITLASVTTNTATITSVDPSNSRINYLGNTTDSAATLSSVRFARVTLTNATTVTATTGNNANTLIVAFEVIEYWPGVIKSVQRGTVVAGATATITTVTTLRANLEYLGASTASNANDDVVQTRMVLTNATTVTATSVSASATVLGFQVVEYF